MLCCDAVPLEPGGRGGYRYHQMPRKTSGRNRHWKFEAHVCFWNIMGPAFYSRVPWAVNNVVLNKRSTSSSSFWSIKFGETMTLTKLNSSLTAGHLKPLMGHCDLWLPKGKCSFSKLTWPQTILPLFFLFSSSNTLKGLVFHGIHSRRNTL